MSDLYVVTVDTRGKSSSDISGYNEHLCTKEFFRKSIIGHPDAICFQSIVAQLCGLNMKIYFHKNARSGHKDKAVSELNRAATLLTLDPETGSPCYEVRGIAYVALSDGFAPLSFRQVWGIQELLNYAKDTYKFDPDQQLAGKKNLLRLCKEYRQKAWGPLSIYEYRTEIATTVVPPRIVKAKESTTSSKHKDARKKERRHHNQHRRFRAVHS